MSEEMHEEHAVAGWEGEGGHHGERPDISADNPLDTFADNSPDTSLDDPGDVPLVETGDAALEIPEASEPERAIAVGAGDEPKVWTIDELTKEYFPNATRLSGGVVAGLQRELRRRNRLVERGY